MVSFFRRCGIVEYSFVFPGCVLSRLESIRDLGVLFDMTVTFNNNVGEIDAFVELLKFLFNLMLKQNYFPQRWKEARVCSVSKW